MHSYQRNYAPTVLEARDDGANESTLIDIVSDPASTQTTILSLVSRGASIEDYRVSYLDTVGLDGNKAVGNSLALALQ